MFIIKINDTEKGRKSEWADAVALAASLPATVKDLVTIELTRPAKGSPSKWLVLSGGKTQIVEWNGPAPM